MKNINPYIQEAQPNPGTRRNLIKTTLTQVIIKLLKTYDKENISKIVKEK